MVGAAVCERGHVVGSLVMDWDEVEPHCPKCGAPVLRNCPHCGGKISAFGSAKKPPEFCSICAKPFPWATREALVYHIQNQLKYQDGLTAADGEVLQGELKKLLEVPNESAKETAQAKIVKGLRDKAPKAYELAKPAIEELLTTAMKVWLKAQGM